MFVVFLFQFILEKVFIVNISCSWCWCCSNINSENLLFFFFWNLRESWDIFVVVWKVPFYCAIKIKILFVGWKCGTFTGETQQNTTANINNHLIETMLRFIENCVDELLQNFPHSFNIESWKFFFYCCFFAVQ